MWSRMKSENERPSKMRGFFQYVEGSKIAGILVRKNIKPDGSGYFVVRVTEDEGIAINLPREDPDPTGKAIAKVGDLVGIRKCGALRPLLDLPDGTLVRLEYLGMEEREYIGEDGIKDTAMAHKFDISVWQDESRAA